MRKSGDKGQKVVEEIRSRLNHGLKIVRVEDGLIIEHRNATYFVAEVDLKGEQITVPLTVEFQDHPDYEGDELVEHALEQLKPSLSAYRKRGYQVRETEWSPRYQVGSYDDRQEPVFIAYLKRPLQSRQELFDELEWLLKQLPDR